MTKTETEKVTPFSLEDVPGLGPVKIKALRDEGFITTFQVIHKNPTWLKDITGMDKDDAGSAFAYMKKKLIDAGIINAQEMSATQLLEQRKIIQRVSSGCKSIDHLIGGGVECGAVTEIFGENGSGKTQFSHSLAIQVQLPLEQGGLAEAGKAPPLVLYIDTENTFRPERIVSILAGKKLIPDYPDVLKSKILEGKMLREDELKAKEETETEQKKQAEKFLDSILVNKATDAYQQCSIIKNTIAILREVPIKLIIIDSGTSLFRMSYLGRGNIKSKFDLMNEMIHDLSSIAELNKVPVLFVNQIYHAPEEQYGSDPDIPYGGNIIGHAIPYRLKLEKSGSKHRMKIFKSPYQDNSETRFDITQAGVVDIVKE